MHRVLTRRLPRIIVQYFDSVVKNSSKYYNTSDLVMDSENLVGCGLLDPLPLAALNVAFLVM